MTLAELRALAAQERAAAQAIVAGAKAEGRGQDAWTEDEIAQMEAHLSAEEGYQAEMLATQERANAAAALAAKLTPAVPSPGRRAVAGTPKLEVVGPAWEKDPKRGFANHREYLLAVMAAGNGARKVDERLGGLQATVGSDEQGEYSDAYGGFFVPAGLAPGVLKLDPEPDPMAGRTTMVPMSAPKVTFNARVDKNHTTSVSGGLTVGRSAETVAKDASRMQFDQVTLNAYSMFGLAYASEELLSDSPESFVALLSAGFNDEFQGAIINERLNGTGVGQYMGILKSPCKIAVAKEAGQGAATVEYLNVVNMRARCWRYSNAVWLYNQDVLPQLMQMVLPIGTGGVAMWQNSAREGEPDLLLGRPAIPTEYCETVGTEGDLVLGNWSQYLEGIYQAPQSADSIHVRFLNHERAFKFWVRNAGVPWWSSPLTPKKSTATLSPFVTLAVRA